MPANKQMLIIAKFWLPVLMCMGFIFYTSSITGTDIPPLFPFQDIIYHLALYLILGFFFTRALKNTYSDMTRSKIIFLTALFGIIYGLSDELHQAFVPHRSISGFDIFIDVLGNFAGSLIYRWPG